MLPRGKFVCNFLSKMYCAYVTRRIKRQKSVMGLLGVTGHAFPEKICNLVHFKENFS